MPENACLVLSGEDRASFLQSQLTSDVDSVGDKPALSAWCSAKGRVIALFRIRQADDTFRLALPSELVDSVEKRLMMFRFRARVDFARDEATPDDLGVAEGTDYAAWRQSLVDSGIPWIGERQSEEFTPHMLNLDLLGAVSFDKGCYPGQEIVARTQFRGATKRRLRRFTAGRQHSEGSKVQSGDRDAGDVVNVVGTSILAVVPVAGTGFSIDGDPLTEETLPYSLEAAD